MAVTITHTTPADGTFSATGAAAWDANHAVSGLGTMAEQDANNVAITGGSITGISLSGTVSSVGFTFADGTTQITAAITRGQIEQQRLGAFT